MSRHLVSTAVIWAALTGIGEALIWLDLFPALGSEEASDFDEIFRFLLVLGIPVFCFVIATLIYAFVGFRRSSPEEHGSGFYGTGWVPRIWLIVTGALAVVLMIHPGLTGLAHLQSDSGGYGWGDTNPELVVEVTAFRFGWQFDYPDSGVQVIGAGKELVLPEETQVKFEVQSLDVVHSLWIPAFRMKIDAIPGRTTFMTLTTTGTGAYDPETSSEYRVQCAELCGRDHTSMMFPVRVVTHEEFEAWKVSQKSSVSKSEGGK